MAVVYASADQINPDGVAYVQIARHYAGGRFDLAVNSYWGPLLSWLLAPLVWLGAGSMVAVKAINVVLGAGLGLAAVSLARQCKLLLCYNSVDKCHPQALLLGGVAPSSTKTLEGGTGIRQFICNRALDLNPHVVLAAALMLVLAMLPGPVTPDVLLAALMTFYFARSARLIHSLSAKAAFVAGLIGGAAYLAKTYALVFVPLHLVLTLAIGLIVRGGLKARAGQLAAGLAGLAVVAGPWVAVISVKDGRCTIGSVARLADAFVYSIAADRDVPLYRLQAPRPGRISVWENPAEIPQQYIDAARPPAGYRAGFIFGNLARLCDMARSFDPILPLGVGAILTAAWSIAQIVRRRVPWPLLWLLGSAAVYAGGYMLVLMETRYLWPIWALLLVLALSVFRGRWLTPVAMVVLAASVAMTLWPWFNPSSGGAPAGFRRMAGASSGLTKGELTAADDWHEGLYASYRSDSPFLGRIEGKDAHAVAEELRPFGFVRVLIFDDEKLARRIENSGLFWQDVSRERAGKMAVYYLNER